MESLKKITIMTGFVVHGHILAQVRDYKFWMLISKCEFTHQFIDNLKANIFILKAKKTSIMISWRL